jgi:beta-barrel assembly-enhancing protease
MKSRSLAVFGAPVVALSLISVPQEVEIGRQAQHEVKKEVPEVRDGAVVNYVAGLGRRLAANARGPKYPYSFSVANYREINAFALPGGPVWVHRGAMQAATSEAQLAGVLAHEIAHISQRHAADKITKSLVANGLLGLLGAVLGNDNKGAQVAQVGARVIAGSYMLKFSRDDEREADSVGATIMRRAGWDPRGMIEFMDTLRRTQGTDPGRVQVFLSSHPAPGERASRLRSTVRASGGRRDSAEFQRIRSRLHALPAAQAMPRR